MITRKQHAFTMIELLAAVAIIAILAAIMLPVVTAAKESSLRTVSASQMRQLAIGTLMYATDYNETLPFYQNDEAFLSAYDPEVTSFGLPTNSKQPKLLVEVLLPYLGNSRRLWFCPADPYAGKEGSIQFSTGSGIGYANELNHLYSSYIYRAFPIRVPDEPVQFPLVTPLSQVNPNASLFFEPIMIHTHTETKSYWKTPVQLNVMPDARIVVSKIPQ